MKFCIFTPTPQREKLGGFLVANFLSYFPRENGLKFITPKTSENFTTFSTARKEICHLELALGATSRKDRFQVARFDSIANRIASDLVIRVVRFETSRFWNLPRLARTLLNFSRSSRATSQGLLSFWSLPFWTKKDTLHPLPKSLHK